MTLPTLLTLVAALFASPERPEPEVCLRSASSPEWWDAQPAPDNQGVIVPCYQPLRGDVVLPPSGLFL